MSILDFMTFGSALALRSYCRAGSSLSVFGVSRLGSSLAVLDFLFLGSALSLRSFARIGSSLAVYGMFPTKTVHCVLLMPSCIALALQSSPASLSFFFLSFFSNLVGNFLSKPSSRSLPQCVRLGARMLVA